MCHPTTVPSSVSRRYLRVLLLRRVFTCFPAAFHWLIYSQRYLLYHPYMFCQSIILLHFYTFFLVFLHFCYMQDFCAILLLHNVRKWLLPALPQKYHGTAHKKSFHPVNPQPPAPKDGKTFPHPLHLNGSDHKRNRCL